MPYGYKFQIGIQRVSEPDPNARRGRAGPVLAALAALALVVIGLLFWPRPAPVQSAPAAHIAAAPTAPARPAPTPYIVRVTAQTGAICILPNGKTTGPVELAEVP